MLGDGDSEQLQNLLSLTDSDLARLDVDEMLSELLVRVRDILSADTAAILLLDDASQSLIARAATGLEEEVRQGVRIPMRQGFAGRIAAERAAVVLDRVDSTTVANPILWEKGIQAMLGVPLLSGDTLLGVVHVGTLGDRRFTDDDARLLEVAAERVSRALQAGQLTIERAASRLLERSLLPSGLPVLHGMELAARYVTAEGRDVGGDWYDAFELPSGAVWVTAGDVAGHGLRAAVVMGRLRTAIRAYAFEGASPSEVMTLTDRQLQHFEPAEMATAVCVCVEPDGDQLAMASAGHPPPVLALPGATGQPLDRRAEPPLGVVAPNGRSTIRLPFPPGSLLALYTDGLVERRGEMITDGIDRLCQAVTPAPPDIVCRHIMLRLIGDTKPEDDIALIVLRRPAE